MSENKKFVLVASIILIIFTGEKLWKKTENSSEEKSVNYIVKMEKHTYKQADDLLDINRATLEDMLKNKISMSYANKIIEYRDITGGFNKLDELMKISGIGEKTYTKLKSKFVVVELPSRKRININKATKTELIYTGFTKKEIKKVEEYLKENGIIFDNVVFLELIGKKRYEELKEYIKYD